MKYIILAMVLMFSTSALADDDSWYNPPAFKPQTVEWLQTPEQECSWWHEFHSYDVK